VSSRASGFVQWHISEGTLWSAHDVVSGPSFHLLFVTL
jgi:hypothetical protein